jgi:hypothetical protein
MWPRSFESSRSGAQILRGSMPRSLFEWRSPAIPAAQSPSPSRRPPEPIDQARNETGTPMQSERLATRSARRPRSAGPARGPGAEIDPARRAGRRNRAPASARWPVEVSLDTDVARIASKAAGAVGDRIAATKCLRRLAHRHDRFRGIRSRRDRRSNLASPLDLIPSKSHSPWTCWVRSPNRRIFSRISSAVLVHLKGLPFSLCAPTYSRIAARS